MQPARYKNHLEKTKPNKRGLPGGKEGVRNLRGAYRIVIKTGSKFTLIRDAPLGFWQKNQKFAICEKLHKLLA